MAGTRSSARLASQQKSSPSQSSQSPPNAAGSKRKAEAGSSPLAKRGRKVSEKKEQKTIEDSMDIDTTKNTEANKKENGDSSHAEKATNASHSKEHQVAQDDQDAKNSPSNGSATSPAVENRDHKQAEEKPDQDEPVHEAETKPDDKAEDTHKHEADPKPSEETSKMDSTGKIEPGNDSRPEKNGSNTKKTNGDTAVEAGARDKSTPSSILEKGVIYFFFRGRVGIDNPSDVDDIARSYMVLRPIPHGAKIGDGPIGDANGKCRLLALPKKVLPLSGKDRFMTFVEKSNTSFKELRDDFMSASDYETKTAGVRHTPPVTPIAEGVYALTTTGRESHLAYMITIPQELGEVQKDIGIREQGSFITSAKNPQYPGPANTNLPESPKFPKEILDEFRSLRWAPLQPKFLDYENAQFLLIGESSGIERATEPQSEDKDKTDPKEELEKLEGEDEIRIKDLKGDDAVFIDLGISKKDYPKVPSTWSN